MTSSEDGFAWTVAEYDRQMPGPFFELMVLVQEARNRQDHEQNGAPLKPRALIELELIEEHIAARELRRRAEAGDVDALAVLVEEAARVELLIEKAEAHCAAQWAAIQARAAARHSQRQHPNTSAPID